MRQQASTSTTGIAWGRPRCVLVKCLDETPKEIADRMRAVAAGLSNAADARTIRLYADWLETHGDAEEVRDLVKPAENAKS